MNCINNQPCQLANIVNTTSNSVKFKSKFAELVFGDDSGQSKGLEPSTMAGEYRLELSNIQQMAIGQESLKSERVNIELSTAQVIPNELYDQKWYSIGKLSYVGMNSHIGASYKFELTNGSEGVHFSESVEHVSVNLSEQPAQSLLRITSTNHRHSQLSIDDFNEAKNHASFIAQAASPKIHELEKKKISILKDGDGRALVIRDYLSTNTHLADQLNKYLALSEHSISKITINGTTSK